jgi:hypothetical protein
VISLGRITPTLISGAARIDPPWCRGCLGLEGWMGDRHTGVPKVLPRRCTPAVLMGSRLKALILSFHKSQVLEQLPIPFRYYSRAVSGTGGHFPVTPSTDRHRPLLTNGELTGN